MLEGGERWAPRRVQVFIVVRVLCCVPLPPPQADAQAAVANEAFLLILEAVWASVPDAPLPHLLLCPTEYVVPCD